MEYFDAASNVIGPYLETANAVVGPYIDTASAIVNPYYIPYKGTVTDIGAAIVLSDSSDKPILSPALQRAIRNNDIGSILQIIDDKENIMLRGKQSRLWNKFYNMVQIFLERRSNGLISSLTSVPAPAVGSMKKPVLTKTLSYKFREELISLIYGSASLEEWSNLMTLFGVNKTVESALEDKKEIMFLVNYLPTIQRKLVQKSNRPSSKKVAARRKTNPYRPETDEEFLTRIRREAPKAFKKFLCENYHIRITEC